MRLCCENEVNLSGQVNIAIATIIISNNNNNNNASRQISVCLRFIYENNKRNPTNYASSPNPNPYPNLDWRLMCRQFPGTHIICMWISIFMTGDASTMAYVIWKIFMKQYARLHYDPRPLSPKLIWHSYAAIQTVGHPLSLYPSECLSCHSIRGHHVPLRKCLPFIDLN